MKRFCTLVISLIVLTGCVQDSPNVKQIANMKFFIENQAQEGINVIEKGLHYAVLNSGDINSKSPELSDTITAHFHGTLTDGTVFWSSVESNEPLTIQLSGLIEGCQKVISQMKINDKWRVYIDPSMAYGDEGRPGIPSNSILVFDIELLDIQ
ncbi:MAG: peptidylprolyl isomerase [Proteobacteria bacterium]|nr:peptidylprolyl isomerase [Pseudomonadota bacterium]NCX74887.1 peptidylprolyl isomerase [Pseudomonadota bacterium]NDH59614.1 peptidylprolyl isomerase [Pseudomonadota bacterium]